ncbi:MAG: hypothetical protein CMJ85_10165 [Planctomycetes bacterium]|nr:hypothetical protein [Planctomycetota bacterium]
MNSLLLLTSSALVVGASAAGQSRLFRFEGEAVHHRLGAAVASAGDLNGDRYCDVLSGAPGHADGTGLVRAFSGRDGRQLLQLSGTSKGDGFGWSIASVGDVNNDTVPDIVIGAPQLSGLSGGGYARLHSGKDGALLRMFMGKKVGDGFGVSVAAAGDVDMDGVPDLIIGAHGEDTGGNLAGNAQVFSGKDGTILHTFTGKTTRDFFGFSVAGIGDVNKDGHADVIVGAPDRDHMVGRTQFFESGEAVVFSGKTGQQLFQKNGDSTSDFFGHSVTGCGDFNKDGWPDFAVGAPEYFDPTRRDPGYARVFSGRDGTTLQTLRGDSNGDFFGDPVRGGNDLNGDGSVDLIVGAHLNSAGGANAGLLRAFSGKDSKVLFTITGKAGDLFGFNAAIAGNIDSTLADDLIVGAPGASPQGNGSGFCQAVSGGMLSVVMDVHTVDVVTGGQQQLYLTAPASQKKRLYHVLGSFSGCDPSKGITVGKGLVLPLVYDFYTLYTLTNSNTVILGSIGLLDDQAKGQAAFDLPKGHLWLRGLRFDHAFMVYDLVNLKVSFVSNARPVVMK